MTKRKLNAKRGRPAGVTYSTQYALRLSPNVYNHLMELFRNDILLNGMVDERGRRKTTSSFLRKMIMEAK